ncbi:hypothetical protein BDN70DRAFT_847172 [Pholiota conissans]|uniref:Uncharacterized protein n=1 Tax=Pholiota conissans TaxID=109636 RepID=A0A9P5ZE46_9AGAR|nr:hypothetical protein BDN70DRAFT_847172 [Pholiota conissans]
MKFILPSIVSALFIGSALAQTVAIGFPFDGASVKAGKNITVEIDRPDTLSGSTEVAVVLGLVSCPNSACPPPGEILGSILYNGPYNPPVPSMMIYYMPPFITQSWYVLYSNQRSLYHVPLSYTITLVRPFGACPPFPN